MDIQSSVFIATSLDGYIARLDGSLDWLDRANQAVPPGEDFGYADFLNSVDILVMGSHSFAKVLSFAEWPYPTKPVVVLSHRPLTVPSTLATSVRVSAQSPDDLVKELAQQGAKHLYVDGGLVIQSFLRAGLIDEITITLIPVLLGAGKPLFGSLPQDLPLQHLATTVYDCGFVQNKYHVIRPQGIG
ncbi:MAG: dihydrofolate reductase family protein [Cyanobacteriota bacterium]|nr:dihydrofolate reductase family protein [Cyanobacteriota bacterium]